MATSAPTETASAPETSLNFPDNRLLIDLCGAFDKNLTHIESTLGVQIVRRGNELAIFGDEEGCRRASEALQGLYQRLEQGREVEPGDVDAALRMGRPAQGTPRHPSEQREMFPSGGVEIRTRKKTVEPRTNTQKDYVKSLFKNELVFGLGPAGTGKTYLAVAAGVSMFIEGHVDRILLSRPAVEAGERLGFLPGDMKDKVDPYMQPLYDALNDFSACQTGWQIDRRETDRNCTIGVYARANTVQRVHRFGRSAECHDNADENVSDAYGRRQPYGDHRRQFAVRPAPRCAQRIGRGRESSTRGERGRDDHL